MLARIGPNDEVRLVGRARLIRSFNRGVSFSIGNGDHAGWVVLPVLAIVGGLAWFIRRELRRPADDQQRPSVGQAIGYGLVAGGAAGNVIDRLVRHPGWGRGAVIDFIDVRFWPVFNIADAALTCGCVLLVLLSLRARPVNRDPA